MKYNLLDPIDIKRYDMRYKQLLEAGKHIELKEVRKKRTIKQNAYLHVVITLFAIEFGLTIEESKTDLKRACDFMIYVKNDKPYLRRTRDMNTKELTDFIEWIRNYAAQQGCYIPTSLEYLTQQFEIDKEIDRHKQYL